MTNKELLQVLDIIKNDYAMHKNHINIEKIKALTQVIECVELMPELVDVLEVAEKFLFNVNGACDCYEDYICQFCGANKVWNKLDELLNKAKELIE